MLYLPLVILLTYLIYIQYSTVMYRRKIKTVIHVNGVRGKSTIVRMLDAVFREHGYVTFSKVTGTQPVYIDTKGQEHPVKRNIATINEQRRILKQASKEKAQILIVECMALREESQKHSHRIFRSDVTLITNIRTDHLEVMGLNPETRLKTLLAASGNEPIIVGDKTIINDLSLAKIMGNKNIILANDFDSIDQEHHENTNMVFQVGEYFGLDESEIVVGLKKYKRDSGYNKIVKKEKYQVYTGFSANDLETTNELFMAYKKILFEDYGDHEPIFWFNDRVDRPIRSEMFLYWIKKVNPSTLILSGDKIITNRVKLRKLGYEGVFESLDNMDDSEALLFGFGNIKGIDL